MGSTSVSDADREIRNLSSSESTSTDANFAAVKEMYTNAEIESHNLAVEYAAKEVDWETLSEDQQQQRIDKLSPSLHAHLFSESMENKLQEQSQLQDKTIEQQEKTFEESKSPLDNAMDWIKKYNI